MDRRLNVLVKASGNLLRRPEVYRWLRPLCKKHHAVIVVGGGSQINREFRKKNIPIRFGPAGRETPDFHARQVARDVLERNQATVQDMLARHRISAEIEIPVLYPGHVLCHANGDDYVRACYNGFDILYVLTKERRREQKVAFFALFPKVKIVTFP